MIGNLLGLVGNLLGSDAKTGAKAVTSNMSNVDTVTGTIQTYCNYFSIFVLSACGLLLTLWALYVGYKMATAEDEGKRTAAKTQLIYTIIGIATILVVAVMFNAILPNLKGTYTEAPTGMEALNTILGHVNSIVTAIISLVSSAGVLLAVWIGWKLMSAEDEGKRTNAKKQLIWTIVGIVGIALINVIVTAVMSNLTGLLGGTGTGTDAKKDGNN